MAHNAGVAKYIKFPGAFKTTNDTLQKPILIMYLDYGLSFCSARANFPSEIFATPCMKMVCVDLA
jgi:hypothetical protein